MGKLRSTIYARMEEMSFRSGATVGAGTLAAAGTAIVLAVTLTGHSAAATSGPAPATPAPFAPAAVAPSARAPAPSAPAPSAPVRPGVPVTPSVPVSIRPVTRSSPAASPQTYQPVSRAAVRTRQASLPRFDHFGSWGWWYLRMHRGRPDLGDSLSWPAGRF